jgi:hypothetical protein
MTIGSWLALVLTVNGLVVFVPFDPYVAVHVDPTAGTAATKAAQLDVAETPAAIETVSLVLPVPPVQYMVNVHTPAATVCAGRLLNDHVLTTPPAADWIAHAVVWVPTAWSTVLAVQLGGVPVPCRYSGLPAALTVGAPSDASASEPNINTRMPTTTQPSQRLP